MHLIGQIGEPDVPRQLLPDDAPVGDSPKCTECSGASDTERATHSRGSVPVRSSGIGIRITHAFCSNGLARQEGVLYVVEGSGNKS